MLCSKYYCIFSFCSGALTDTLAKCVCLAAPQPPKGVVPPLGAVKGHDNEWGSTRPKSQFSWDKP